MTTEQARAERDQLVHDVKHGMHMLLLALGGPAAQSQSLTAKDVRCAAVSAVRLESMLARLLPDESAA